MKTEEIENLKQDLYYDLLDKYQALKLTNSMLKEENRKLRLQNPVSNTSGAIAYNQAMVWTKKRLFRIVEKYKNTHSVVLDEVKSLIVETTENKIRE